MRRRLGALATESVATSDEQVTQISPAIDAVKFATIAQKPFSAKRLIECVRRVLSITEQQHRSHATFQEPPRDPIYKQNLSRPVVQFPSSRPTARSGGTIYNSRVRYARSKPKIRRPTSMKLLVILLTLLSTTIGATAQQPNSPKPADSPEVELRAFMAELRKASIEGDVDTIANSMTDDYVQTDINGYRQDKTTWLNEYFRPLADLIKAGKFHWVEFERTNLQFRFYGHCAIVTGELHAKATGARPGAHAWVPDPNASFSGTLHFTHVYIKKNGKWMLAALHNQIPLPLANTAK